MGVGGIFGGKKIHACGIRTIEAGGGVDDADEDENARVGEGGDEDARGQEELDAMPVGPVEEEGEAFTATPRWR